MTSLSAAALAGLACSAMLALATWIASVVRRDASLVDRVWALLIVGAGWTYWARLPTPSEHGLAMLLLASAWAVRLSAFITWRNWGHGEDRRYQAIRARNQPGFAVKSLVLVFALQAVLAWVVSAPLLAGLAGSGAWNAVGLAGLALAAFGLLYEALADQQLARFKADPARSGQVLDSGLWRYSRHPNYFGEACVWWGLGLAAAAGGGPGAWSLVSPVLMTVLLLRVSGVPLQEQDLPARRPTYRDYVARTNAFFPGRPRRPPC